MGIKAPYPPFPYPPKGPDDATPQVSRILVPLLWFQGYHGVDGFLNDTVVTISRFRSVKVYKCF